YNDSVNNGSGLLANTFIGNAAFSGVAGEYRYYSAGGQTFVEADTDGDGVADQMLTLANGEYALVETEAGSNILAKANLINGTDLRDIIDGTSDRDVIHGGLGNDTLRGNEGDDALYGEAGNDFLDGGAGNDILEGDDGNDTLSGRSGFNILDGGDGFDSSSAEADVATGDTVVITGGGAHVTVSQGGVVTNEIYNSEEVLVRAAGTGGTLTFDASNFVGTPDSFLWMVDHDGTDVMIGSASSEGFANVWVNVSGADVFTGNGGADIFDYTWAVAGMNGDTITDFDFDDVIDLSLNGSTELWGNGGYLADHFIGGADFSGIAGEYRFSAHDGMTFVEADTDGDGLADQVLTLANGEYALVETLAGSNILMRANALIGTEGADLIVGTGDRDVIQGLGGDDTLRGGTGDDQLFGGAGNDRLVGNGGNDQIDGGTGDDIINTGFGTTVVSGGEGYDVVYAELDNSLSDTVYVTGTSGSVTIAQGGTVTNQVNDAEEVLVWTYGSAGTVTLDASGYVSTGEAILWLVDHDGSDVMIGSDGNDYFGNVSINLSGSDVFTGNGGSDLFDYTYAVGGMNNDTIMDFEFDETIDLRFNDSTNQNYEGALLCDTFIGNAAFSGVAGEYRYSAHDGQTFVEADTNGDALADQVLTIANGEFVLVETFAGSNILKQAASGVAADGLLAGATVFMDVNGDGLWNEGEAITITDADGRFLFDSPSVGTLVVTGGTNVDTGLPNLVTMSAPLGSGVVNPLTTLVQALVESSSGAMTADDAAAAVASALGISGSIDLLNTDVYSAAAAGDADALAAQKAAATVVALIAATADAAGADAGEQAIANLAELIGGGGAVDLTDEETIGQVLDGAMPSDQVDSVAAGVADAAEQIAETTSLDELSDAQADALTRGNDLDNILVGGNQSDDLVGLGGSDQMSAGAGDDRLDGGLGADLLVGGSGADVFAFTSVGDSVPGASDLISDFSGHWTLVTNANGKIGKVKGDWDLIDLSEIDANSNVDGDQAFTLSKKFTGSAGQAYSDYDSTNGITNVHLDVDGDAVADMTIQLQGQANLVGADFIL
ncbi:MAG TPA: calcium-binding protein, partial [Sphingomicrobium sp.]|nr:calcium-binding protein [Sphingomicrobium sp.]